MLIFNLLALGIVILSAAIGLVLASPLLFFKVDKDIYYLVAGCIATVAMTFIDAPKWNNGKKGGSFFYLPLYIWGLLGIGVELIIIVIKLYEVINYFFVNNRTISIYVGIVLIMCAILLTVISKSDASKRYKQKASTYVGGFMCFTVLALLLFNPIRGALDQSPTHTPTITVTPSLVNTATSTYTPTSSSTPTPIPTKTKTPRPTKTATETPFPEICFSECGKIRIINDTGGPLTVSIKGIQDNTFELVVGTRDIDINPGFYTISATARCGFDIDTITIVEGVTEEITYYCSSTP